MRPGDIVLYAGVGPGEDAVLAGQFGANVTCIDVAPKMLQKVESRFRAAGIPARMICGNVLDHKLTGHYDIVVANFFLNVFAEDSMRAMLTHLASLGKAGREIADRRLHRSQRQSVGSFEPSIVLGRNEFILLFAATLRMAFHLRLSTVFCGRGIGVASDRTIPSWSLRSTRILCDHCRRCLKSASEDVSRTTRLRTTSSHDTRSLIRRSVVRCS